MESTDKIIASYNLTPPTSPELRKRFDQCSRLEFRISFLISQVDQNLYSFICGIVAGLPISVLFNCLDMEVDALPYKWLYFSLYILLLLDTVVMTVAIFKFTLLHIKINEKPNREKVIEKSNIMLYQQIFDSMNTLRKTYWMFILSLVLFAIFVIALFAINNFDFGWLFQIIYKLAEPVVTP